jgi:dihydrofolate reductase
MILGANTYAMAKGYWPTNNDQGEYGEKLNKLTRFVASSKLKDAPWGKFPAATVTADPIATVQELKKQNGKDIWLWGSLKLMQSMFEAGEVDEVHLRVCPTTRGKGVRMFENRHDMQLISGKSFENGVVILQYKMKK